MKAIATLSGFDEIQVEEDYNGYQRQFALAKTMSEMAEAREVFERKYGKYTLTACNVASIAAVTFSVISSAALANFLSASTGFPLAGMAGIGVTSMLTSLLTVAPARALAIRTLEVLNGEELKSDFDKYTKEALREDKAAAAREFEEKHGSFVFYAVRSSERLAAIVTTFAVSALTQYALVK